MITLRPYQASIAAQAADALRLHGLVYLAMEVRTGKTITALTAAKDFWHVLFVTKKKAISSIVADAEALGMADRVTVTNYEQLPKMQAVYDLVIVDEAHGVGAFPKPSLRAKELKRLCKGKPIIYLSGTPTPESFSQFYHQFWITEKSPWAGYANFYRWAADYVNIKTRYMYNREVKDYSKADAEKITKDICHLLISFSQKDAGFDQEVNDIIVRVPMPDKVRAAVRILKRDKIMQTKSGGVVLGDTAVKLMNKVHQLCGGTVIDEDGGRHCFDDYKARFIRQTFEGKKIAIFYKFQAELDHIKAVYGEAVTHSPEEFNRAKYRVFVSQIQSGREGVNLSTADAIVMYNIDFSAVSYWQARARLQAKDRQNAASVFWVFTEGGIEDDIFKAVKGKMDFTLIHFKESRIFLNAF